MFKIILVLILLYILLNCYVIGKNADVLDAVYQLASEKLGWSVPKIIIFIAFAFCAVFIFGLKRKNFGNSRELSATIEEVIKENNHCD